MKIQLMMMDLQLLNDNTQLYPSVHRRTSLINTHQQSLHEEMEIFSYQGMNIHFEAEDHY